MLRSVSFRGIQMPPLTLCPECDTIYQLPQQGRHHTTIAATTMNSRRFTRDKQMPAICGRERRPVHPAGWHDGLRHARWRASGSLCRQTHSPGTVICNDGLPRPVHDALLQLPRSRSHRRRAAPPPTPDATTHQQKVRGASRHHYKSQLAVAQKITRQNWGM